MPGNEDHSPRSCPGMGPNEGSESGREADASNVSQMIEQTLRERLEYIEASYR